VDWCHVVVEGMRRIQAHSSIGFLCNFKNKGKHTQTKAKEGLKTWVTLYTLKH